ncbi:MAG: O-antigen ligase domain-containing protein [Symploca sp. SIO2B6]|nr:O-antigen ligase domain-containing protein [Symploca sp. SIO2B6]
MKPQNLEETLVWYYITGTYVLFFLGAQYVVAPMLAYFLVLYLVKKLWEQNEETPPEERISIPLGVWIWIVAMLVMGLALVVGHLEFNLGTVKTIKSFVNSFLRTWALLAVFPLIGCLKIRPQLIYRAICILGIQTLVLVPLSYLLSVAGIPMPLFTNYIFAKIGGNSTRYYAATLYISAEGATRLSLFAPWSPALALIANVHIVLAEQEPDKKLRYLAIIGNVAAILGSASRLGLLCLIALPVIRFILVNLSRPSMQIALGISSFVGGLFGSQLLLMARDFKDYFDSRRAASSRVRGILGRLAIDKWRDAPIWGHAVKSPEGPYVAAKMPIGSHHTWFGALYLHGLVGVIALAIPMIYSLLSLFVKAQQSKIARTGLGIILVMFIFSLAENLEGLAFLYWPGLMMLGIAFKEKLSTVFA